MYLSAAAFPMIPLTLIPDLDVYKRQLFMLPAVAAGLYYEEWKAAGSLFTISLICISVGFVILTQFRFDKIALRSREGFFIAFASWIYCSLLGALPLYLSCLLYTSPFSWRNLHRLPQ